MSTLSPSSSADRRSTGSGSGGGGFKGFLNRISGKSGGQTSADASPRMGNGANSKQASNSAKSNSSGMPSKFNTADGRTMDVAEAAQLIPKLEQAIKEKESQIADKDAVIRKQNGVIAEQLAKITKLQGEILELKAECDKVRSVLSQPKGEGESDEATASPELLAKTPNKERSKKQAVSAEPSADTAQPTELVRYKKSANSKQLIRDAILANDFLRHLDSEQVLEMVECMYEKSVPANCWVIREGESGAHLYVAADGSLEVSKDDKVLGPLPAGRVFGELAILYNCTRTASVKALTPTKLWVLDRQVFQMITMRMGLQRHETLMQFLQQVPLLKALPKDRISKLADCLEQDVYAEGTYIVRQGEKGDHFFIISSGDVRITQSDHTGQDKEVRILHKGDFFGEKALQSEDLRTANAISLPPGVEVLALDRDHFKKLIGDVKKDYGDRAPLPPSPPQPIAQQKPQPPQAVPSGSRSPPPAVVKSREETGPIFDPAFKSVELTQLKPIATLGVGGFGRVEMVHIAGDKSKAYALKAMKKRHIVDTRQQEHIFSERNIMLELRSTFVVRLYKTYRDKRYVYMLLECCLGGELWTILRDKGHFDDTAARFYTACVLEALEYLHTRSIIYRDLKPENCLLETSGFLKIVDFGFAKKLGQGRKTWTFCGTPEYVAPEIILNKGHDRSADFWALGIYICELLIGRPPFQASDPMKTYTLILKGVDALDIPNRRVGKTVTTLVKKLCRDNPGERMGLQSGGIEDIRKHKWFTGFDFDGLRERKLKPPHLPKVSHPCDASNFDQYPPDTDVPPEEQSGWDEGF